MNNFTLLRKFVYLHSTSSGISSVGRAAASQAAGHEFEPRIPLQAGGPFMEKLIISNDEMFTRVSGLLAQGKRVTIPVKGCSMLPLIVGERDLVELEASEVYKPGDIVLFILGRRWILHRILRFDANGNAVIRGDGVARGCEICPPDGIKGKAINIIRKGKKPFNPYTRMRMLKFRIWDMLRPFRRYILFAYRHLPWNRKYFKNI